MRRLRDLSPALATALLLGNSVTAAPAQDSFVNFETPHVHPLELTSGGLLLAVNTADAVLEVFDATGAEPVALAAVPVGYDPVSVRARTATEVWVVNHLSDSVSVVDLNSLNVVATLPTDDEPCDVVFAGSPERAFVSCSQANSVLVFDPLSLATAPTRIEIEAEDPRALAVSPDGAKVYAAIFESGNASTLLGGGADEGEGVIDFPPNTVNHPSGPYGGQNPPPNSGNGFQPPLNGANPTAPEVGLIVKRNSGGQWMDDNGGDWTAFVSGSGASLSGRPTGWDLPDRDVAVIDANTLGVTYAEGLMNMVMALDVNPNTGDVTAVGTDGINEVRFEPNLKSIFLRVNIGFTDAAGATLGIFDLNDHLDYSQVSLPFAQRERALGDPRGIVWNGAGTRAYVAGMGSDNVVVLGPGGTRVSSGATIEVGEGPTGLALDEGAGRLYVLNKFDGSISVVSTSSEAETARVSFHDATPGAIKIGRKHLYSTHDNSGLGQVACASCHVDARMDRLSWDLGDPAGEEEALEGNCPDNSCEDWHPMKGPMLTQTLQDIIGKEPHHWRGDRAGIEGFDGAFSGLQGADQDLDPVSMQEFEDFLATIHFPPNPFRDFDNSLPTDLVLDGHYTTGRFGPAGQPLGTGDAVRGLELYTPPNFLDAGALACVTCHTLPTGLGTDGVFQGLNFVPTPPGPDGERHHVMVSMDGSTQKTIKVPQLRNLYERTGMNTTQTSNSAGFGFLHDGSVDSIERFVSEATFNPSSDQDVADLVAFMLAFSGSDLPSGSPNNPFFPPGTASLDAHAAVGAQHTYTNGAAPSAEDIQFTSETLALANNMAVALFVKGVQGGEQRGYAYVGGGVFQSDRQAESLPVLSLLGGGVAGSELTMTVVPVGSEIRLGIDRDLDGFLDGDERDAGSDPADPLSTPLGPGILFCFGDGTGTACPCNNAGPAGEGGCLNSTGEGARLVASGVPEVGDDSLVFHASGMPAGKTALLFQGNELVSGGAGNVLGDGLLCTDVQIVRLVILSTDNAGELNYPGSGDPSISNLGSAMSGDLRRYQVWYRDPPASPCGNQFNLSNAYELSWQ